MDNNENIDTNENVVNEEPITESVVEETVPEVQPSEPVVERAPEVQVSEPVAEEAVSEGSETGCMGE